MFGFFIGLDMFSWLRLESIKFENQFIRMELTMIFNLYRDLIFMTFVAGTLRFNLLFGVIGIG